MYARYSVLCRTVARVKPPPHTGLRGLWSAQRPLSGLTSSGLTLRTKARRVYLRLGTIALTGALGTSVYLYLHRPIALDSSDSSSSTSSNGESKHPPSSRHIHEDTHQEPLTSLIRTYIVYSMCSIPWLVDHSPKVLSVLTSIPLVREITEAIVRGTFLAQFVGGETALETVPVLERLRAQNMAAMLHFGAEVDEGGNTSSHTSKLRVNKGIIDEIIRCIDVAGDFEDKRQARLGQEKTGMEGRKTWVAIKLTALIPNPNSFINFSKHLMHARAPSLNSTNIPFPGIPRPTDLDILSVDAFDLPPTSPLTGEDLESLRALKDELFRLCTRAKERGVVVCVDAEHSWYQPAIEAFQLALMREFNRLEPSAKYSSSSSPSIQPLIYGTFQTYLRRATEHLEQSLRDAEEGGYALGVKLVRGAYHPLEVSSHLSRSVRDKRSVDKEQSSNSSLSISPDPFPPVWQSKAETDACFDTCARMLVHKVSENIRSGDRKKNTGPAPRIGLIFGIHNPSSCQLVLDALVNEGLATRSITTEGKVKEKIAISKEAAQRIAVGQLYGMCDDLSSSLASRTSVSVRRSIHPRSDSNAEDMEEEKERGTDSEPFVMKYIPYGPLRVVMPYLGRRAIENKAVLAGGSGNGAGTGGSAREERIRARREIWRRVKGWFGLD